MSEELDRATKGIKKNFNALGFIGKTVSLILVILAVLVIGGLLILGIYRAVFITEVKNYQIAVQFDRWGKNAGKVIIKTREESAINPVTGKQIIKKVFMRGWVFAYPFKSEVYALDLRPMQVQMNANSRILNAKLIQFNPEGLQLFLSWHGLDNYEGPGGSTSSSTNTFSNILLSYAYDGLEYPFLRILRELRQDGVNKNPLDGDAQEVIVDKVPEQTEFQLGADQGRKPIK